MANHTDAIVRPGIANRIALVLLIVFLLGGASVLLWEDAPPGRADDVATVETSVSTTSETGKTSSSTTTQKTMKPAAEPSMVERLATPAATLLAKILLLLGTAFVAAALIQRTLLGHYAIKFGSVEIGEIPVDTAKAIETVRSLAEQTARGAPAEEDTTGEMPTARPENREPEENVVVETNFGATGFAELLSRLERIIRSLATPPPIGAYSPAAVVEVLANRGVVPPELRKPLDELLEAGDRPELSERVPRRVRRAAERSGQSILESLAQLRRSVAQRFEDHVLDTLAGLVPEGADLQEDARRGRARFDAVVSDGGKEVVIEVRSRLTPHTAVQLEEITAMLCELPPDAPFILVVAGSGLTDRQLNQLRSTRPGAVHLLRWDVEAESLGRLVERHLR